MRALAARTLLTSSAIVLAAAAGQASAQNGPGVPPAQGSGNGAVSPGEQVSSPTAPNLADADAEALTQDIIVTANKREQSLLRVPAAISVLTGDNLRTQGVNNVQDLQNLVPTVNVNSGRDGATVAIRGVVTTDTSSKGEQDVAFNIDGFYVGRGNARGAAFFDIDRVEVLRGPQGTLYGRSSTGGAINIITAAPRLGETSGYVRAEYGNYDTKRAEGAINLPLGDQLAVRLSGAVVDRDGYSKPIANTTVVNGTTYTIPAAQGFARNNQKDATGRASLFGSTGGLSARLTATVGHQGGEGNAPALETQLRAHNDRGSKALAILANPLRPFLDSDFANFDGHVNAELGSNLQLDALGSYQWLHFRQRGTAITDPTSVNYAITRTFQFANTFGPAYGFYLQDNRVKTQQFEARLSNTGRGVIDFVAGANYFREAAGESGQSWAARIDAPLAPEQQYIFQNGPVNTTIHKGYGVFGQATWNVTDRIGLVGGLRYTRNEISRIGRFSLPFNFDAGFPPPPFADVAGNTIYTYPNACVGAPNNGGSKDGKITFRAGINFQVTPHDLLYASIASGFKGGTFNDFDPSTRGTGAVGPSSVIAYEAGYKGRPLPGLTFSSSLFYYDFSRYQITGLTQFLSGAQVVNVVFTSATPVRLYGWENEFTYQLARQTAFNGSVNFLHSNIEKYQGGTYAGLGYPIDYRGQRLDQNPKFTATAALNHAFDLAEGSKLRLRGGVKYSSSYLISDLGSGIRYRQPSFTRTDASVTYELSDGKYSLQLYVENIENKVQRTSFAGYSGPYGGTGGSTGSPVAGVPFRAGNGTIPVGYPANYLNFYTSTPRFFGARVTMRF